MKRQNPLELWFQQSGHQKVKFADTNDIARNTLFDILGDKRKDYGVATLKKIERGTGGDVTVLILVEWLDHLKRRRKP